MRQLLALAKGFPGHPTHPPLTDASIGAYTVGVAMLIAGALGLEETAMAHGALLAIGGGLAVAAPTALTGLLDWLDLQPGTPPRRLATIHLFTMVTATLIFAATFAAQFDGYKDGDIRTLALALGIVAEVVLAAGGYIGGTIVYVHAHRVIDAPGADLRQALVPGALERDRAAAPRGAREPSGADQDAP
jgi:uncharacterized membrane protein